MSKALKKLIDINILRAFKNKLVGAGSAYVQTAAVDQTISGTKTFSKPIVGSVTGNAATATKLQTARTINGTSFNGTANITTANWGTARNITITDGTNTSTAVSVNGSANVALQLPATIKANLTGNAATATTATTAKACTGNSATATKATQDSAGQQIDTTYIKGLAVSGRTITYTKGDGSTGTITTQDTNTWTAFKGATSSANGTAGYVPAPTKGNQNKFFKADGTWATPTNTTYPVATTKVNGLMSAADKAKLDGIAAGANNYTHPSSHPASMITGLAKVATSGSYNDLANKPAIPTVNNATLTIQKNGTTVKTFTANASANVTANITVPTKVSELTNDSGFLTGHQSLSNYVTLNGAQTISGAKTFTGNIIGINKERSTEDANSLYSTTAGSKLTYYTTSNGGTKLANVPAAVNTTLESRTIRRLSDSDWIVEQICHNSNGLYYRKGGNGTWGAWKTFAFTDSNISGNAATATKATQDAAGNTITTTYATKAENNTKANDSDVVHKSGNETIAGTKTFSDGVLSTTPNAFMAQRDGYTLVIRNDGSNTYFLMSDKDGVPGTWNDARPLVISNSTGVCDINGSASTATKAANADHATKADSATKAASADRASAANCVITRDYHEIRLDWDSQVSGCVGLRVDETNMGGIVTTNNIRAQWYAAYPDGAEAHNAMWGGRDITAAFNNGTVSTNIANGSFKDIFPGDYITKQVTISGTTYTVNWVVADCDYWWHKGDQNNGMETHHVVIVPQQPIFKYPMNGTNNTVGGYAESRLYTSIIPDCTTGIVNAFGSSHILTFRDHLTRDMNASAVPSGITVFTGASNWNGAWYSQQCNLMSEAMVYDGSHCASSALDNIMATRQMSAFRLSEKLINYNRQWWWLRDVVSSEFFAAVDDHGGADAYYASARCGVRPFALLV